jgi:hypothetical protein
VAFTYELTYRELLACAFLQEPVDPGSRGNIFQTEQIRPAGDLPMQCVIGLQLEVEELAHVALIGTAPPVVVRNGGEVSTSKQRWYMIKGGPQQCVHGIAITPDVVVIQLVNQPYELRPVEAVRPLLRLDRGNHLCVDVRTSGGLRMMC